MGDLNMPPSSCCQHQYNCSYSYAKL